MPTPPDSTPSQYSLLPEQPTVISKSTPTVPPEISDSAHRILEGRILPGDHLGHFELIEYVGGGGMGRVFRATDTRLARTVALKILPPDQAADPETLQRFQNEAQSAARLDHDNIARVHYVGEDRGIHFIAFEFVEGVNLRVLMERKGVLPLGEAVIYVLQVAEALSHADSRQVVHRDIKPSNVLITPEGRVKLIDMGLARLRQLDPDAAELTASGVTLGTFDYISPEQARDPRNADIRSDIYSLGCTFFFMLTGRPPFPQGTVLQKLLQHQSEQPPEVRQFRPDLPEEIAPVLRRMLAKDPQDRYRHPAELVADLTTVADRLGIQTLPAVSQVWLSPPERRTRPWRRHLPWMAAVAALVAIVLFLNRIWTAPGSGNSPTAPSWGETKKTASELPAPPLEPAPSPPGSLSSPHAPPGESPLETVESSPALPRSEVPSPAASPSAERDHTPSVGSFVPSPATDPFTPGILPFDNSLQSETLTMAGSVPDSVPPHWPWELRGPRYSWESRASLNPFSPTAPSRGAGGLPLAAVPADSERFIAGLTPFERSTILIVGDGEGPRRYRTLQAACDAAQSGDVIELHFTGRREQRPLRLTDFNLTIRSGEGYRPVLLFRPDDADPVKYPRGMFSLSGGRLTLSSVAVEFETPRDLPAESWSLVEIHGGQTLQVQRCVLTVRNTSGQNRTYHPDVAFFRVQPAPAADAALDPSSPSAVPLATLELTDTIARGEAALLVVTHLQPVHLVWENGLLATTECLVAAGGGTEAPKAEATLQVDLRHLTAEVRGGLCRLTTSPDEPYFFPVHVNSLDNIFFTSPGVPLLEQIGVGTPEDFLRQIVWNGNRNYYQQADVLWRMEPLTGNSPPEVLDAEAWKNYWGSSRENQPRFGQVIWKHLPSPGCPVSSYRPADFALGETAPADSALDPPGDGCSAGLIPERLPPVPLDPTAPTNSPGLGTRDAELGTQ
ncbi:MAG: serine/threonine protein kinase [Pirellulales bacterium]|nr:serine/threonine protein kinase [Pirellulales bacterium]